MRLLQVVPALGLDGVGGYARALGEALAGRGVQCELLAARPAQPSEAQARDGVLPARTAEALDSALESWWRRGEQPAAVLLHYVSYGYQARGCPVWLVSSAGRWAARGNGRRLATFFHEVNAFGPPWRSSFWLSPLQRRLAAALAGASTGIATSLGLYRDVLARWVPRRPIAVLPVFSAVGEPDPGRVKPVAARPRRLAVFGAPANRERAFRAHRADLAAACRALGIEEVLDVGPSTPSLPEEVAGRPVRRLGALPAAALGELLLGAAAGFLAYPPGFLPKSTVFAAYCAHGMVPVCAPALRALPGRGHASPLAAGEHYLPPRPARAPSAADLEFIAGRARCWYAEHSLARQADAFVRLAFDGARPA